MDEAAVHACGPGEGSAMQTVDIALILFGAGCCYAPVEIGRDVRKYGARTARTIGRVIGHVERSTDWHDGDGVGYRPPTRHTRIQFAIGEQAHECISSTGATFTIHHVGDEVPVRYDPDDPANADLAHGAKTSAALRLMQFGFPVVGVSLLIAAAVRLMA
jgi:hypothetical protein